MKPTLKLDRTNEINIIAYQIGNDFILGRKTNGDFVVKTVDDIVTYMEAEMQEFYGLDIYQSDFERLGWRA